MRSSALNGARGLEARLRAGLPPALIRFLIERFRQPVEHNSILGTGVIFLLETALGEFNDTGTLFLIRLLFLRHQSMMR